MLKCALRAIIPSRLAIVPLSGTIIRRSIDEHLRLFKALEENEGFKGVMLELESPGGSAAASECLHDRLRRLNAKKPLYCYALMAASGGYMAASAARKVYAPSTAVVGSIGVLSLKPVVRELMERMGIGLEVMKKGAMKDMSLFHRESTEEEKKSWEALHQDIYERFIEMVAEARGMERERVRELATGEVFSARRAVELSLIDGVRDFDSAMEELFAETGVKPGRAVVIRPKKPFIKRVLSEAAGTFADETWSRLH
jgi:protease-4